jgi:hypothetical protein
MAYTGAVKGHDTPTCRQGITLPPTIPDEEQSLERADQDYGYELLII